MKRRHLPNFAAAPVPSIVAAIVRLAEPNCKGLPNDFLAAWNAAPDLARAFIDTSSDEPRFAVVDDISGLRLAEHDPDHPHADQDLVRAIATLRASDQDSLVNVTAPVSDAAFYLGIAYAAHMLLGGGK